ncbi:MAG: TRAP transporter substrate-binding protein DctP [Beijerinckiaceae bacterium]
MTTPVKLAIKLALPAILLATAGVQTAMAAEAVLRTQTALPRQHDLSKSFLKHFVEKLNAAGKGVVRIDYIGGPEVTPANKAADALKRGVFDLLHTPAAYHVGIVPQGMALMPTNQTPQEYRAAGAMKVLEPHWQQKLNANILAIGETGAQFHLYTVKEPVVKDGKLDLKGFKLRTTGAYRPLILALGATPVQIAAGEVYTGLQRGVVDGFGWPTVGLHALGLDKVAKFRIDPPFYHLANLVLVNQDKWKTLSKEAQAIVTKVSAQYEQDSIKEMQDGAKADTEAVQKEGVKIFKLEGDVAKAYLKAAYEAMWKRAGQRIPAEELKVLRSKLYKE